MQDMMPTSRDLILSALREHGPMSSPEVRAKTGLTPSTLWTNLRRLEQHKWMSASGENYRNHDGRRNRVYSIKRNAVLPGTVSAPVIAPTGKGSGIVAPCTYRQSIARAVLGL